MQKPLHSHNVWVWRSAIVSKHEKKLKNGGPILERCEGAMDRNHTTRYHVLLGTGLLHSVNVTHSATEPRGQCDQVSWSSLFYLLRIPSTFAIGEHWQMVGACVRWGHLPLSDVRQTSLSLLLFEFGCRLNDPASRTRGKQSFLCLFATARHEKHHRR